MLRCLLDRMKAMAAIPTTPPIATERRAVLLCLGEADLPPDQYLRLLDRVLGRFGDRTVLHTDEFPQHPSSNT